MLCLVSCHDAPRKNPFDPELTPAVELAGSLDDAAGTVALNWTAYVGEQAFAGYRVLRNVAKSTEVDTLATIENVERVTYVDTTLVPNTGYVYRVLVVNASGYEVSSEEISIAGYEVRPVPLISWKADVQQGVVDLAWNQYRGARFEGYRLERRRIDQHDFEVIAQVGAVGDTTYRDGTLVPGSEYFYRVAVAAGGAIWESNVSDPMGFGLQMVQLLPVELDYPTGTAHLAWTRYSGSLFRAYRVERRRSDDVEFATIGRLESADEVEFADGDLEPDFSYAYRIVLEAAEQEKTSNTVGQVGFSLRGVELLSVESDPQAGVMRLHWERYLGPDFQFYQVHRREFGAEKEAIVLWEGESVADTSLVDEKARAGVAYVYTVLLRAAGQEKVSNSQESRLVLAPVQILGADFSSETATAAIEWSPYTGPRFRAYRVLRLTEGSIARIVGEIEDRAATTLIDSGLHGNTRYSYQVVVLTERDEEVESGERGGIFHEWLMNWPLEVEEDEYVRLYAEPGERILALVSGPSQVRRLVFDTQGTLFEEQVLLSMPGAIEPRTVGIARREDDRRFLGVGLRDRLRVLELGEDGLPISNQVDLDVSSWVFDEVEKIVVGEIGLVSTSAGEVAFDNITVSSGERLLFAGDFSDVEREDWQFVGTAGSLRDGWFSVVTTNDKNPHQSAFARKDDESWEDFRLESDVVLYGVRAGIRIGSLSRRYFSRFSLTLDSRTQQAEVIWDFSPPRELELESRIDTLTIPVSLIDGLPYRLRLGMVGGVVQAEVKRLDLFWDSQRNEESVLSGLAAVDDNLLFSAGGPYYDIGQDGSTNTFPELGASISDVRSWEDPMQNRWIGICLPFFHQVLFAKTGVSARGRLQWPNWDDHATIGGTGTGQDAGELLFPLSLDFGEKQRVFVLDAGNGRIQVFDAVGEYLTQWGNKGEGNGEFDFGSGRGGEDFAGSVMIDSQGCVYVADFSNQRIQKFGP